MPPFAVRGTVVRCPKGFGSLELLSDRVVIVESKQLGGKILAIAEAAQSSALLQQHGLAESVLHLKAGQFLVPGFVDLHVHAPQYSYTGTATDRPLMEWLDHYTFPRESRHQDVGLASREYSALVKRLISHGTTTALYFATLRLQPTLELADVVEQAGQRGLIGKVCMDRNSPEHYTASCEENLADTEAFIKAIQARGRDCLLEPVITPRFVPSCTPELLHGLGKLAAAYRVPVQSHISESLDEVAFTKALHPEVDGRDTPLLENASLLTDRCIMAHGVCLRDDELRALAAKGTAIAHCPLSNFYFADVLLRVRHCIDLGVLVGLGTDVAGGYSPSMLSAIRNAVITSKALRMQTLASSAPGTADADLIDWKEAFYLATMGGATALGIQDKVGSLEVGKQFDALLVDCSNGATFDCFEGDTELDAFEKFLNLGDDRNISHVWVKGARIK